MKEPAWIVHKKEPQSHKDTKKNAFGVSRVTKIGHVCDHRFLHCRLSLAKASWLRVLVGYELSRRRAVLAFAIGFFWMFSSIVVAAGGPADDFKMAEIFPIDTGHSYVGFSVQYMGFARVRGRFAGFSGSLRYVDGDITKTSATVIIQTESLDTDHDVRDKDLKSDNWFDVAKFPIIKFQSTRTEKSDAGVVMIGNLTIKDVTREVKIKLEQSSGIQKDIRGDTQIIFTGTTRIDRKVFGVMGENWSRVKEGMTAVAAEVEIELSILGKQINAPNFSNRLRNAEMPQGRIYQAISTKGVQVGLTEFDELKTAGHPNLIENTLNTVGYMLLKEGKLDEALKVFIHNGSRHPDNANLYDSLAEAYAFKGDRANAVKYYRMAVEKDPLNANAIEVLRHLEN